jgi:hypothetical protein
MAFRPYQVFFPGKALSEIYPLIKENLTKKTFYENQRKAKKNKENRELFLERKSEKRKRNYFIELNKFRCG